MIHSVKTFENFTLQIKAYNQSDPIKIIILKGTLGVDKVSLLGYFGRKATGQKSYNFLLYK